MKFYDKSQNAKDAIDKATLKWLHQASVLVQGSAVRLSPVDTARLKKSIDYQVDDKNTMAYVGTNVEYAIFVEFGTGEFAENGEGRKGGWFYKTEDGSWYFTKGQEPQPFLRPAFIEVKPQVQDLAKEIYRRYI